MNRHAVARAVSEALPLVAPRKRTESEAIREKAVRTMVRGADDLCEVFTNVVSEDLEDARVFQWMSERTQ